MKEELYCNAPWTALFVHPTGGVKCCCSGVEDWGNLEEQTIEDILSSDKVIQLKKDLIAGNPNSYCNSCREGERLSGTSQRSFFKQFKVDDALVKDPQAFKLHSIDIRWQNLCNLTCVYCRPEWSTGWAKIEGIPIRPAKVPYHENIINFIKQHNSTIEGIIVAGGEPLLHKQNVRMLEILDESVQVGFISNLSIDVANNQVFNLLKTRKNVTWSISLEGLDDRFNYVRRGADFEKLKENLQIIKENLHQDSCLYLFPVYCIFSIDRLIEYYEFAEQFNAHINWQHIINPKNMNPFHFNQKILDYAEEEMRKLLEHPIVKNLEYNDGFMAHTYNLLKEIKPTRIVDIDFRKFINEYEKEMPNKFAQVFPEIDKRIIKI